MTKRTALIGGGANGIGLAVAEALARAGHSILITGRTADSLRVAQAHLRSISDVPVHTLVNDISSSDAAGAPVAEVDSIFGWTWPRQSSCDRQRPQRPNFSPVSMPIGA